MLDADAIRRADAELQSRRLAEFAYWGIKVGFSPERADALRGAPKHVARWLKAQVAGNTTETAPALAELRNATEALLASPGSVGYFDALRSDTIAGEPDFRYAAAVADPVAGAVSEGAAIRVSSMLFGSRELKQQRAACIVVLTQELLRFGRAIGIIETLMRRGLARAIDQIVIAQLAAGAPTVAASGNGPVDVLFDLRRALGAIPSGADARFRVGVGVELAKKLALQSTPAGERAHPGMSPTGGILAGLPCSVSEALTANVIVTEATAILSTASEIEISESNASAIEMANDPTATIATGSPPAPVEVTKTSLFQIGATAMRIQRHFDWAAIRPVHTCVITGAGNVWGLNDASPPA